MNFRRNKTKVPSSNLRSRLDEYSTLKEKARWPLPDEERKSVAAPFLNRFPFSVLREMHQFLLFKVTLVLLVILLVLLMSFINIPFFAMLLNNIYTLTTWQMDVSQAGKEIMPVVQQLWEGSPEVGLERPVVAPPDRETPGPDTLGHESGWERPVEGVVEIPFGLDRDGKMNYGVVFRVSPGADVSAAMAGYVKDLGYHQGTGYYVVLEHPGGMETIYGHLAELHVEERQDVTAGQVIGQLDGTELDAMEAWFYFEARENGKPLDPLMLLPDDAVLDN